MKIAGSEIIIILLYSIVTVSSSIRLATNIIRFVDDVGNVRHGSMVESNDTTAISKMGNTLDNVAELIEGDDIFGSHYLTGEYVRVTKILSPVADPPTIYAIGCNYQGQCDTVPNPEYPTVFMKNRKSLNDPNEDVVIPYDANMTDYEVELGIIISKDCKDVSADDALGCVLGYSVVNDVSNRWWQSHDNQQWPFSKSFDTHCPIGPVLVTKEILGDASGLKLQMHLNGQLVQDETTSNMIFGVRKIIEFISMGTTIEKGSVIATGTPAGTGNGTVRAGDIMIASIEKIGKLSNPVVKQKNPHAKDRTQYVDKEIKFGKSATRIIRFLDEKNNVRHGSIVDSHNTMAASIMGNTLDNVAELIEGDDIFGSHILTGKYARVVKMLSPIVNPPAIYAIGCNYAGHCGDLPNPEYPTVFFKNRKSLTDPDGIVIIPKADTTDFHSNWTERSVRGADYEAELAIIISKDCKDVSADDALDCVLGYSALNDVTGRWWQGNDNIQWTFGKSFDTYCPLGPALVTKEELGDASNLHLQLLLNGQVMQNTSTSNLIFGVRKIIEFITKGTTIEKGTVIASGTPPGTGMGILKDGDTMVVKLDHVGSLKNIAKCQDSIFCPRH